MRFNSQSWKDDVYSMLEGGGVIDAHHHMLGRCQRRNRNPGLLDWIGESYLFQGGMRAAGLDTRFFFDPSVPDAEKITALLPCLKLTRAITYYRIVRLGLLAAFNFDLDQLDEGNWRRLDEMLRSANVRDDWFDYTLRQHLNLVDGVLDMQVGGTMVDAIGNPDARDWYDYILRIRPGRDPEFMRGKTKVREMDGQGGHTSVKIDSFLYCFHSSTRDELAQLFGGDSYSPHDLPSYLAYVDSALEGVAANKRNVALKSAIAGLRRLEFRETVESEAGMVFKLPVKQVSPENVASFEDYVMRHICRKAGELGLPIQFHTGSPFSGANSDRDCAPCLMTGLIASCPETRFDLMHGGYPYTGECATLAARFPNVYLNLSWLTMMSDNEAKNVIKSWIEQLPAHKLMWGGDCVFSEETLGCYLVSRDQVAGVVGEKVSRGEIGRDYGLWLIGRIFKDNAAQLFSMRLP